ncbi:MAG: hypothetical protein M3346_00825, partial [Actinomycetota bacterium]|nr:hypothetical protein [Actinomycetota bacterium]
MGITRMMMGGRSGRFLVALLLLASCTDGPTEPERDARWAPGGAPSTLARRLTEAVTVPGIRRHQRA